jgi:predicted RND superfamily exporter protein
MGYLGIEVNPTVITLPIYLGLAVSIGYSVHVFNFFHRSFSTTGDRQASVLYAMEETGWPIFFTAATTIGALMSFYFVSIRHVLWMGTASAAVVAVTYVIITTFTPAALSFGKNREPQAVNRVLNGTQPGNSRAERVFIRFSQWILAHPRPIIGLFCVLLLFLLGGITRVSVSMDYERTYGLKVPYIAELYYVGHTKIGSLYSYDIVLTFEEQNHVKDPHILKNVDILASEAEKLPLVKRVSSLLDVIKDMNQIMHNNDLAYYRVPDERELIAQLLLLYELSNGTEQENWVDYEYTTLRLMVEVSDYNTAEVEQEFRYIENRAKELFPDAEFRMVGTLAQISLMQNYVAKGEIVSCLIALVVIGLLMMLVFQSIKTGLIGMIPNLAPVVVVLGLMGYLDIPLDMTTMVIIPVMLGLAVDDTIHFINHSKLEFQRTGSYQEAIQRTFVTVGKAIFMTSFILVVSFSAYFTSVTLFFVHLAVAMTAGVLSALLADYFMTPILVHWFQPFGKEIKKEKN